MIFEKNDVLDNLKKITNALVARDGCRYVIEPIPEAVLIDEVGSYFVGIKKKVALTAFWAGNLVVHDERFILEKLEDEVKIYWSLIDYQGMANALMKRLDRSDIRDFSAMRKNKKLIEDYLRLLMTICLSRFDEVCELKIRRCFQYVAGFAGCRFACGSTAKACHWKGGGRMSVRKRSTLLGKVLVALKYISLILITLVCLAPIILAIVTSLKSKAEVYDLGVLQLPERLHFENYVTAFVDGNMLNGFMNTVIMLGVSLIFVILDGTMLAYIFSRFEFRGKKLLKNAFLFASIVPSMSVQVMVYRIISALGVYNTRMAGFLLYIGTDIIAIYIFLQQLSTIPVSLDEAAIIDGASYFTVYRRIILPLLRPAITTIVIIKGVGIYNDFYIPYQYMPKNSLRVVATTLFQFKGQYGTQWEVICAGAIITVIPILIIFILLQKQIYNGLIQGSIK